MYTYGCLLIFFFFKQKTAYEMRISDWSSDVCSSDLRIGGVTLQIVRVWVVRFNAEGPDGLIDRKAPGASPLLDEEHRRALAQIVEEIGRASCRERGWQYV